MMNSGLFMFRINGKFTTGRDQPEKMEAGIFSSPLSEVSRRYRHCVQTAHHIYISQSSCLQQNLVEEVWKRILVVSAHLLQVGRQQKLRRQKLFLFVDHFSLTGPVAVGACRDEVHVLADGVKQQPFKAAGEVGCVNRARMSIKEAHKISLKNFQRSHGDLFPFQSCSQPAIDPLEAVLSSEGRIYIPLVLEESVGIFLLGLLQLQQRQQPLLLLARAVHEVIPRLYVVSIGAGLSED